MAANYEQIIYDKTEAIAKITFNRPNVLNAITVKMQAELRDAFLDAERDDNIRVIVVTGKGRGFCSGEDVHELADASKRFEGRGPRRAVMPTPANPIPRFMHQNVEKPVIAMVNGTAAGMGYCIALAADLRIASENARFCHVYLRRGLVTSGETWYLPRYIGLGSAMLHLLMADDIDAQEAYRLGLVQKLVPAAELEQATMEIAEAIAAKPPLTVKFTKKAVYKGMLMDYMEATEWIGYARAIAGFSGEFGEGTSSFLEKRAPQFR